MQIRKKIKIKMWLTSSLPIWHWAVWETKAGENTLRSRSVCGGVFRVLSFVWAAADRIFCYPSSQYLRSQCICVSSPYHEWASWCVRFHGIHACVCIFIEERGRWWSSAVHLARHHMLDCDDWTLYGATEAAAGISKLVGVECKAILGFGLEYFVKHWAVCAFSQWECTPNLTRGNANF